MPESLTELHKYIQDKVRKGEISPGVGIYAVGWIFYDIFERAEHQKTLTGKLVSSEDLDRFVREIPLSKIDRDITDAEQAFGRDAFEFLEEDTQRRIREAIDDSIVATVKNFTSSWKAFGMNVIAGVIAGLIFAGISLGLWFYVKIDPSINAVGKNSMEQQK